MKSNRLLLEALSGRGHTCSVVARNSLGAGGRTQFHQALAARGIEVRSEVPAVDTYHLNGVEVNTMWETPGLRHLWGHIRKFDPTWILVSSEDPLQWLLSAALKESASRVIYMAYTTLAFPFGPDSGFVDEARTALVRRAARVVAVSEYIRDYLKKWGGVDSTTVPVQFYGSGPFPDFSRQEGGL